jgi:hypothetical protein
VWAYLADELAKVAERKRNFQSTFSKCTTYKAAYSSKRFGLRIPAIGALSLYVGMTTSGEAVEPEPVSGRPSSHIPVIQSLKI